MTQDAGNGHSQQDSNTSDGQVAPEAPASGGQEGVAPTQAQLDARAEIEEVQAKAQENWEKYLRVVAELENLRKRSVRDVENARKFGVERLAAAILPVRDSIEAALGAAGDAAVSDDVAAFVEGERATLRLLEQAFESAGIHEIDPQGEVFDPARHEAMTVQPSAELPPDTVALVVQKGYELNERLLRPARVIVVAPPPDAA